MLKKLFLFSLIIYVLPAIAQGKQFKVHTIAFYNVENLFDTINDSGKSDDDYLPKGKESWTGEKYKTKLANIARVLSEIGTDENNDAPAIIGLSEIENRRVLEDLVKQPSLITKEYGILHFDSPDSRGIDVALLYRKKHFKPTSYVNKPLIIKDSLSTDKKEVGKKKKQPPRLLTRDQLLVTGLLDGEEMHFIVNHWPSRYGGEKKSSPNREAAAVLNRKIIDSLYRINPNAKVVTMGDFNDGPYNNSIKKVLGAKGLKEDVKPGGLYNPMEDIARKGNGSVAYRDAWDLFDQMIITEPFLSKDYTSFRFWKAKVFNKDYLTQPSGQYKGYPLRNAHGEAGYSDHFPVYLYLIKQM
ncbi:Endonuclease/Exonuclease/phosphatase family protein [compost metagenome]